jgi:hypothetical protein
MILPIRVEKNEGGSLNVIPIDFFVKACSAIMDDCFDGGVFHIVSERPKRLEELIDYISRFFKIKGIEGVVGKELVETPKTTLEKLFDNFLSIYYPYMSDTRIFSCDNAHQILSERKIVCPELSYDVFEKCMQYAIDVDWGKKLKRHFQP